MTKKIIIAIDIFVFFTISYFVLPNLVPGIIFLIASLISDSETIKLSWDEIGLIISITFWWFIFRKIHLIYLERTEVERISIRFFEGLFAMILIQVVSVDESILLLFQWFGRSDEIVVAAILTYTVLLSFLSYLLVRHKNHIGFSFNLPSLACLIIFTLFWSPWMMEDGGENVLRKVQARKMLNYEAKEESGEKVLESGNIKCDGVSLEWAPFGVRTECFSDGNKYVTFWGQEFDLE